MKLNQVLLIILIVILVVTIMLKLQPKQPKVIKKVYVEDQQPRYPFVQYDIREVLPPSRRTYLRYPFYFHRYGIYHR